ncbi:MAG: hypothetical protein LBM08_05585 [Dysgonamonadaceae bacterium]|nr:hypothetical protein [Dysgonamonadaceae bacterium]
MPQAQPGVDKALLTLNFKGNILSSAWDFYHTFQYDSESLTVGRLSLSESKELSAHAGFLGRMPDIYGIGKQADLRSSPVN